MHHAKTFFRCLGLLAAIAAPQAALAQSATENFSRCLVLNSTGGERLKLVKWIALAITTHPSISDQVAVPPAVRDAANRDMAEVVETLITEKCVTEARAAFATDGVDTFKTAFKVLGEVSGREVFDNPAVQTQLTEFAKRLDTDRIQKALE